MRRSRFPHDQWPQPWESVDHIWALWGLDQGHLPVVARYINERLDAGSLPDSRVLAQICAMLAGDPVPGGWSFRIGRRGGKPSKNDPPQPDLGVLGSQLAGAAYPLKAVAELASLISDHRCPGQPWKLVVTRPAHRPPSNPAEAGATAARFAKDNPVKVAARKRLITSKATFYRDLGRLGLSPKSRNRPSTRK